MILIKRLQIYKLAIVTKIQQQRKKKSIKMQF